MTPLADLPINVWLVGQEGHTRQRRDHYTEASVRGHPGKLLPALARRLIEAYTRPGEWILDPLSGIGTVGVEAVHLGRHYVGIELEPQFVAWQQENLDRARNQGAAGRSAVYEGDARKLADRPPVAPNCERPAGPFAAVLTSPPYGDRLREQANPSRRLRELIRQGVFGKGVLPGIYGRKPGNLGNLPNRDYLAEMRKVYQGCFDVLRPGGILAIVIQPERADGELQPLHHDTARLCRSLGFAMIDEITAVYGRIALSPQLAAANRGEGTQGEPVAPQIVAHASFWRRLTMAQQRRAGNPITLGQVEYVLVFRKPLTPAPGSIRRLSGPPPRPLLAVRQILPVDKSRLPAALAGPPGGGA